MADVYFKKDCVGFGNEYYRVYGIKNVKPEERSSLSLELAEYIAISGDIGTGDKQRSGALTKIRSDLQKAGHRLHFK